MKLAKFVLVSFFLVGTLFAGNYKVDPDHSNVGFKVKHLMISNVSGKFDKFSGSFEYDEKTNSLKSLIGIIEVASINTEHEKRDGHLKSADFFDVKNHPKLIFTLEKVEKDYAYGRLTIRGVSKTIKFDFENNGSVKDPWGDTRVGLGFNGKINRKDFGLNWNKALEAGGVVVGEVVKLNIELEGILNK